MPFILAYQVNLSQKTLMIWKLMDCYLSISLLIDDGYNNIDNTNYAR